MSKIHDVFGTMVFNDAVMREKLPSKTYSQLKQHVDEGTPLTEDIANVVASSMKSWALSLGATHYTHWFQPMTGTTAEKHDSFIVPAEGGQVIMHFSGKELIKGEPDASSFPSGGIRATFEARGYTAWDPSSYAFIKENTLCIPTAFCSFDGEALDKKTPLLASMEAIEKQAKEMLALFDINPKRVNTTVGAEQEYFLIPKDKYDKRKDLRLCGRTLFGLNPPKTQQLEDHYFGTIKPSVQAFMEELNIELWKMGVLSNTEHNEVAPSQHELAPIFSTANIAADHNQLTMEMMKKVAERHNMVCLLHEKPFDYINGSGKHINWSLATNEGENLLKPGKDPLNNLPFLLLVCAVLKGVDEYQDLLRISVASASNDHRLGGSEAPPAIISVFLGDDLTYIMELAAKGSTEKINIKEKMDTGAAVIADFYRDTTDRNRTSPFAFTGGRFEFRMPGSGTSVSCPTYMINTIVADSIAEYTAKLKDAEDLESAVRALVKEEYLKHKKIIFNGNNYSDEWKKEALERGLMNIPTTPDAFPRFSDEKNIQLFKRQNVLNAVEVKAREEICVEEYNKVMNIEANTMYEMTIQDIIPAVTEYSNELAETIHRKIQIMEGSDVEYNYNVEKTILSSICTEIDKLYKKASILQNSVEKAESITDIHDKAKEYAHSVIPAMNEVRASADILESLTASKYWPMPTYEELLF